MPTAAERMARIRLKIERAKDHIRDLENRIKLFRESDPYRIVGDIDPQTRERVFRLRVKSHPPQILALIVGEAIFQLRSSLDHLAWQLVEANGNTGSTSTYFPIYETFTKYKSESPGKVKGMSASAISLIDSIKPYQGGNDDLWMLNTVNNFDKHRLLVVIAFGFYRLWAASFSDVDLPPKQTVTQVLQLTIRDANAVRVPTLAKFPILQDNAEITRMVLSESQVDEKFDLSFEIAFGEPKVVEGNPIIPFLHQLSHLVDGIVSQFISCL